MLLNIAGKSWKEWEKSLAHELSDSDKRFLMLELKKLKEVQDNEL
nr:MAG TPA: hypothetical protein [Caudoviricetes sp.]DAW78852.1 MAG TPA: hypothetical protein [Caudoviricetes sp.]